MLKIVLPVVLALGGLGAGVGAGLALKPEAVAEAGTCGGGEPAPAETASGEAAPGEAGEPAAHGEPTPEAESAAECAEAPEEHAAAEHGIELVALEKPFVVPIFEREAVVGMVVLSLSVEVAEGKGGEVDALLPRLRDSFLAAMFRHANSGGFEGSFTDAHKMADLKAALRGAAREAMPQAGIGEVLVTEIVRQDV